MKSFLVTGGNGYIGSHMCKFLFENGHQVVTIDNHSTSPEIPVHRFAKFYKGDIGDKSFVSKVLTAHRFDAVFHFAARSVVSESEQDPFLYISNNTVQSSALFEALIAHKINNIIFSSTSSVYGENLSVDFISEDTPTNPSNAYALSKKLTEDILVYLGRKYSLNIALLRYFNVAGSDPGFEIGENHSPETHLIPNLCLSYINKKELRFKLFGNTYPTPDGTCIRDYIHVCDLVRAHYLAFENFDKSAGVHTFNLGSGKGFSVKEVMQVFEKLTETPLDFEICPARPGDPARLVCQIQKAQTELGFRNSFGLEDCVKHSLEYLKKKQKLHLQTEK